MMITPCLEGHDGINLYVTCPAEDLFNGIFTTLTGNQTVLHYMQTEGNTFEWSPRLLKIIGYEDLDLNLVWLAQLSTLASFFRNTHNHRVCNRLPLMSHDPIFIDTRHDDFPIAGAKDGIYQTHTIWDKNLEPAGFGYTLVESHTDTEPSTRFADNSWVGMPITRQTVFLNKGDQPLITGTFGSPGAVHGRLYPNPKYLSRNGFPMEAPIMVINGNNSDAISIARQASGLIIIGGSSCHLAVLARGWKIPAICVPNRAATSAITKETWLTLDGTHGLAFEGIKDIYTEVTVNKNTIAQAEKICADAGIKVLANADTPEQVAEAGCDVGLVRLEHVIQNNEELKERAGQLLQPDLLFDRSDQHTLMQEALGDVIAAAGDHHVTVRFCDAPSHEFGLGEESNPMMGKRGCRAYHPSSPAFTAVRLASQLENVTAMHPLVAVQADLAYLCEGDAVMIETPAAVELMGYIHRLGIEKVSIGTNDLTQFMLGLSRDDCGDVIQAWAAAGQPDPFTHVIHPVLKAVRKAVRIFNEVTVCGNHAAAPESALALLEAGARNFSVPPSEVSQTIVTLASAWTKMNDSNVSIVYGDEPQSEIAIVHNEGEILLGV